METWAGHIKAVHSNILLVASSIVSNSLWHWPWHFTFPLESYFCFVLFCFVLTLWQRNIRGSKHWLVDCGTIYQNINNEVLKCIHHGAPGWLSQLSDQLLISTQVMISQFLRVRAPYWALCWQCRAFLGFSLSLSLSLFLCPTSPLCLSK